MFELPGIVLALFEVAIWIALSKYVRRKSSVLSKINTVSYYWITFTILTGIWEMAYLHNYQYITQNLAKHLLETKTHVWFNKYPIYYILPWKFSDIFYAEYGAYADREYMSDKDTWSHMIEGTHWILCGIPCLIAMIFLVFKGYQHFRTMLGVGMGCQMMNSILYMAMYQNQVNTPTSVNYNTPEFPIGLFWIKRPFMLINLLWTILPAVLIYLDMASIDKNPKINIKIDNDFMQDEELLLQDEITETKMDGVDMV
jgi:hypothetical protein